MHDASTAFSKLIGLVWPIESGVFSSRLVILRSRAPRRGSHRRAEPECYVNWVGGINASAALTELERNPAAAWTQGRILRFQSPSTSTLRIGWVPCWPAASAVPTAMSPWITLYTWSADRILRRRRSCWRPSKPAQPTTLPLRLNPYNSHRYSAPIGGRSLPEPRLCSASESRQVSVQVQVWRLLGKHDDLPLHWRRLARCPNLKHAIRHGPHQGRDALTRDC